MDQVYLGLFLVVALRWSGIERTVAVGLYLFRLVGFLAFEVTGQRELLLVFPNVFEPWFLAVGAVHHWRPGFAWRPGVTAATLAALTVLKEVQEWALHGARLFDGMSSLEFLDGLRRALLGP